MPTDILEGERFDDAVTVAEFGHLSGLVADQYEATTAEAVAAVHSRLSEDGRTRIVCSDFLVDGLTAAASVFMEHDVDGIREPANRLMDFLTGEVGNS